MNSGREFTVRTGSKTEQDANVQRDDRSAMAVPLLWQDSNTESESSVLGVLIIWGRFEENFGEDALDIMRIFATIASAAMVNSRLYTNLQSPS